MLNSIIFPPGKILRLNQKGKITNKDITKILM
jgi:hypothetical protein